MRRRDFIVGIAGSAAAWPLLAKAQRGAMTRLGVWLVVQRITDRVREVPPHGAWLWRLRE
jgi:hypothetical protein